VGGRHLKLSLRPPGGKSIDAIGFRLGGLVTSARDQAHLVYRLAINDYRGIESPQLIVEHLEWKEAGPP